MDVLSFNSVTASNIKDVMERRSVYYNEQVELLRTLIESDGVTIENLSNRRQSLLQGLAVDIGSDLSLIAKVRLQIAGSPYYKNILDDYSFYLKDLLQSLRLYASAETRSNFV